MNTFTGNRGLTLEEPLLFDMHRPGCVGVDMEPPPAITLDRLGGVERPQAARLPDVSEPQLVRHYTRLSQKNYSIDSGFYPLGSCTMKHNPRLSEKMARLPGLADLHPLQPVSTVQGALGIIHLLAQALKELTGMPEIAMSPAAGAHGEWCGLMTIRAYFQDKGQTKRTRVLVPDSAHGTNPASAALCGFTIDPVPARADGRVDLDALKAKLGDDVAALMLTNPNTCGLFETDIIDIAQAVHAAGAFFYCDGANFNAIMGRVRIADLGVDAMHINLHKTFSTPHGGGGPGAGPTVLSAALAPYAPLPFVVLGRNGFDLIEDTPQAVNRDSGAKPFGRVKGFHGQFGVFVRALAYILSMGGDGLAQASGDAVLNANYLLASLKDVLTSAFDGLCMHECLFNDDFLKETGITTLDFAKAMIDEGFHPMTMYFPLVVHGAMLMEPTETESKDSLDEFIGMVRSLAQRAKEGEKQLFLDAPLFAPRKRLDETQAARQPRLKTKLGD